MTKKVVILFGTESGNAEFAAEDMAEALDSRDCEVVDMTDFEIEDFSPEALYLVISSTHGEGELPSGAVPFLEALERDKPDLTGVDYAMFGLGDSSYEHYSRGSEIIDEKLTELGARRVGEYGRHDAETGTLPNSLAVAWAKKVTAEN
jgi:MioC protein